MKIVAPEPHPAQCHFFVNLLLLAGKTDEESQKMIDDNPLEANFMQVSMDFLIAAIIAPMTVKDVDLTNRAFYVRMHGFSPAAEARKLIPDCMLEMIEKYRGEKFESLHRAMYHFDPYLGVVSVATTVGRGDEVQTFVFMTGLPQELRQVLTDMARQGLMEWHGEKGTLPSDGLPDTVIFPFIQAQQFLVEFLQQEIPTGMLH